MKSLISELLVLSLADFVWLGEICDYARLLGAARIDEQRLTTLNAVETLLHQGLWMAGDLGAGEFNRWACSANETMSRIRAEWAIPRALQPTEICWFAATEGGRNAAQALLAGGYRSITANET